MKYNHSLDDVKDILIGLGYDHIVTDMTYSDYGFDMEVSINLKLFPTSESISDAEDHKETKDLIDQEIEEIEKDKNREAYDRAKQIEDKG